MKNFILLALLGCLCFSCGSPCDDLDCGANGTCDEVTESCICDDFYEGASCQTETRARFLGEWSSTSNCTLGNTGNTNPDITISIGAEINKIVLQSPDIYSNRLIEVVLSSENSGDIVEFTPGSTVNGTVSYINESSMIMSMTIVQQSGNVITCTYTMTK